MWPFRPRASAPRPRPRPFRYERFGGIAQLSRPRALVFVDRDRARALGHTDGGHLWAGPDPTLAPDDTAAPRATEEALTGLLAAPLEAHLQLTNRCTAGCEGCYTGATPAGMPREWGLAEWKRAVDALAQAGVFHLALGGGESAELPWLGEIAAHARARGLVPNLTTSGLYDQATLDRLCGWAREGLFGQVNVSVDGVGEVYARVRGTDGFDRAERAVIALRRATRHVGINCVVTRDNFDHLDALFAWARRRRLRELELLRFKPAGRGAATATYARHRLDDAQHRALLGRVLDLARRHRRRVRLDCSFTPMIVHNGQHRLDPRVVRFLAIYGCAGGDALVAARAHGGLTACSFAAPPPGGPTADEIATYWEDPDAFGPFRRWREAAREPCASCPWLTVCRGGCRAVSSHVAGDPTAPDPECPRVVDHRRAHGHATSSSSPTSPTDTRRRLPVIA